GLDVKVEAPGEGVQVGQVSLAGADDPSLEPGLVFPGWGEHLSEGADQGRQGGHLGAGGLDAGEGLGLAAREAVWPGEQGAGWPAGGQVRAVAVQAALAGVADEEAGAALVAALADLPQQLLNRDAWLFRPALAEVVTVGAGEGGPVLRDALQPLWLAG